MKHQSQLRIIGGKYKGTILQRPPEATTRPTANRVREAIFNILSHKFALSWAGIKTLDTFAGSGALSFEALSRGAAHIYLCEADPHAQKTIRWNINRIQAHKQATLFPYPAQQLSPAPHPIDLLFIDPPYETPLPINFFQELYQKHWINDGSLIVWEQDLHKPPPNEIFHIEDTRAYARTRIDFMRLKRHSSLATNA